MGCNHYPHARNYPVCSKSDSCCVVSCCCVSEIGEKKIKIRYRKTQREHFDLHLLRHALTRFLRIELQRGRVCHVFRPVFMHPRTGPVVRGSLHTAVSVSLHLNFTNHHAPSPSSRFLFPAPTLADCGDTLPGFTDTTVDSSELGCFTCPDDTSYVSFSSFVCLPI